MDQNAAHNTEENIKEGVLSDAGNRPVILNFDGGSLASDAGALLLRETEDHAGIIRKMAEIIPKRRLLYKKIYCARGEDGLCIKDHKL